jgi:hypothetical protein
MLAPVGSLTPETREIPRWVRILFPSVADLVFLILFWSLFAGALSGKPLADGDVGWHIRNGEQILQTTSIPHSDPFSSSMSGQAWFGWEWLYDILLGAIHVRLGLNGVVWWTALVIAGIFSYLLKVLVRRGTKIPIALLIVLLAMSASTIHFFARPHIISWLFLLIFEVILERWDSNRSKSQLLYFLPLLMLVWVNMHGGFLFGIVLLACYWIGALIERFGTVDTFEQVRRQSQVRRLSLALIATVAATFVNPYGYRLHLHVVRYLNNRFLMDQIDEFRSPDFHGVAQKCFLLLVLLTMFVLVRAGKSVRASGFLVLMLAVAAGLYASRNIPLAAVLIAFEIGPPLSKSMSSLRSLELNRGTAGEFERSMNVHFWPALLVLSTLIVCVTDGRLGAKPIVHAQFDPQRFPVKAAEWLTENGTQEPIFCPDYWGGYVIYRMWPHSKVVVDDRHDFYGEHFFREYLALVRVQPGWDRVLDEWKVRNVLIRPDSSLATVLPGSGWQAVYRDETAVLFERATPKP